MAQAMPVARVPLLDRLADAEPERGDEARPLRALDRAGLQASVERELLHLFNRRVTARPGRALSVIDYGLPDWSALSPSNPDDRIRIARDMVRAIAAFEPRLRRVRVEVMPSARGQQTLVAQLSGALWAGQREWPVLFGIELGPWGARLFSEAP